MEKNNWLSVAEGVMRAIIVTVIILLAYAIILNFAELSLNVSKIVYLVTTLLSIMYGTIYAVKKVQKKGWIIGIMVSAIYMLLLFVVSLISGHAPQFGMAEVTRVLMAILVGAFSGMLGINI